MGVNSKRESWSSVKEKMYEDTRMGNSSPLPGEDMEKMTFPPLACDGTSEFPLVFFGLSFSHYPLAYLLFEFNLHSQISRL